MLEESTAFECSGRGWDRDEGDWENGYIGPGNELLTAATFIGGDCDPDDGSCGSWLAVPFFVSYIVVTAFVVLNMMIALILHTYAQQKRLEAMAVTPAHEEAFQRAWAPHDPTHITSCAPLERGARRLQHLRRRSKWDECSRQCERS